MVRSSATHHTKRVRSHDAKPCMLRHDVRYAVHCNTPHAAHAPQMSHHLERPRGTIGAHHMQAARARHSRTLACLTGVFYWNVALQVASLPQQSPQTIELPANACHSNYARGTFEIDMHGQGRIQYFDHKGVMVYSLRGDWPHGASVPPHKCFVQDWANQLQYSANIVNGLFDGKGVWKHNNSGGAPHDILWTAGTPNKTLKRIRPGSCPGLNGSPIPRMFTNAPVCTSTSSHKATDERDVADGDGADDTSVVDADGDESDEEHVGNATPPPVDSGRHQRPGESWPSGEGVVAADGVGGKFLSLDVKGCKANELVCADRLAPTAYLTPVEGYVPYRSDTLLVKTYDAMGGGNCLLEGMMVATGMGVGALKLNAASLEAFMAKVKYNPEHGPSMGMLDQVLREAKSPFGLPALDTLNGDRKWTTLLNLTEGVFLVLALVKYTEGTDAGKTGGHFVVFDAWRDLFIIGPGHGVLRVEPEDKADEQRARVFLREHFSLVAPLRVCKLVVAANRVSETKFNTPADYEELEAKRQAKLKRKRV